MLSHQFTRPRAAIEYLDLLLNTILLAVSYNINVGVNTLGSSIRVNTLGSSVGVNTLGSRVVRVNTLGSNALGIHYMDSGRTLAK